MRMLAEDGFVPLERGKTVPQLLLQTVKAQPNAVSIMHKHHGIWKEITWKEYEENVRLTCLGLMALGFGRGDKAAILMEGSPEWYYAEVGTMSAGGATLGLWVADELRERLAYLINLGEAKVVFVEDQQQADKILEIRNKVPSVQKVIVKKYHEVANYHDPFLMSFAELQECGRRSVRSHPDLFDKSVSLGQISDLAALRCTSGTTGEFPKLICGNYYEMFTIAGSYNRAQPVYPGEHYMDPDPSRAWASVAGHLIARHVACFPESPETFQNDFREVGAVSYMTLPSVWEAMASQVMIGIENSDPLKKFFYGIASKIGYRIADMQIAQEKIGLLWRLLYLFAYWTALRSIKDDMGFLKTRQTGIYGEATSSEILRLFRALGINVNQVYGLLESPLLASVTDQDLTVHTVGRPHLGREIRVSQDGELLVRTGMFNGYYNNPEATEKSFQDGWYKTGDAASIDPETGHLIIFDRLAHLARLQDNTQYSAKFLESKLTFSPYIKYAIIPSDGQRHIAALIEIDRDVVEAWAEKRHITFTTFRDLTYKAQVKEKIREEIRQINDRLPDKRLSVKQFALLERQLDPDELDLTVTAKIRREAIVKKYAETVKALFGEPNAFAGAVVDVEPL